MYKVRIYLKDGNNMLIECNVSPLDTKVKDEKEIIILDRDNIIYWIPVDFIQYIKIEKV